MITLRKLVKQVIYLKSEGYQPMSIVVVTVPVAYHLFHFGHLLG